MKNFMILLIVLSINGCTSTSVKKVKVTNEHNMSQTEPTIVRYILGKPNMHYYNAEQSVAKRWGIHIEHIFAGCVITPEKTQKSFSAKENNKNAIQYYDKKFGKDWQIRFEKEVKEESNKKLK